MNNEKKILDFIKAHLYHYSALFTPISDLDSLMRKEVNLNRGGLDIFRYKYFQHR